MKRKKEAAAVGIRRMAAMASDGIACAVVSAARWRRTQREASVWTIRGSRTLFGDYLDDVSKIEWSHIVLILTWRSRRCLKTL